MFIDERDKTKKQPKNYDKTFSVGRNFRNLPQYCVFVTVKRLLSSRQKAYMYILSY